MVMRKSNENIPFYYRRGKLIINGCTGDDRHAAKIDIIMFWVWRIIATIVLGFVL